MDKRFLRVVLRELDVVLSLVLDAVQHDFTISQDCGPLVVHRNLLDRAEVLTLTH